jgi:hypothetical protein
MKDIVEIIKALAWPLTVFSIVLIFKKEVKDLINDIKISLSFGDKKIDLSHDKAEELKKGQGLVLEKDEVEQLKEENKKHSDIEKRLLELQENTTKTKDAFFLGYHFERTYRLIFGSQLIILNLAYQHGAIFDPLAQSIYRRTTWANTYPYDQYIGFLISSGLIGQLNSTTNSYTILPIGKAFIEYLIVNNIQIVNKLPY